VPAHATHRERAAHGMAATRGREMVITNGFRDCPPGSWAEPTRAVGRATPAVPRTDNG
jgi:hypothetical protein